MPVGPGVRFGPYEVISALGAGGMGEVYRARDARLKRDVALKTLPETFALDPDRLARFKREAQVLASLNHPHIGGIYGFEESDGVQALVLELVDGPTLADRIAEGPIPLDEALTLARQIAEALEAAHEQGIVHRDLKPANIKLRPDGTVKVLDFGLAKAFEPASAAADLSQSPTITIPVMTGVAVLLGTAAYMSPEQARGKAVNRRSDIWAFGCVLYEMLTGRRLFGGEDVAETLAAILTKAPDWAVFPTQTPAAIRTLLRRCLEKDPRHRLDSAAAARMEIDDALTIGPASQLDARQSPRRAAWIRTVPWVLCGLLILALATAWLGWRPGPREPGPTSRLELTLPEGVELLGPQAPAVALSPDGTRIAFVGLRAGARQLFVRRLDQSQAVAVRGALPSGACVFFAPDGSAVGFIQSDGTLMKATLADSLIVPVAHGADFTVCATWTDDDRIVFIRDHSLWQVPASGGAATPLLGLDRQKGEVAHAWPMTLGASDVILFASTIENRRDAHIEALSLTTGKRNDVVTGTVPLAVSGGHLVFFRDNTLFAVPVDADRLVVTGTPVRVVDDVAVGTFGGPLAAVSRAGALVYASSDTVRNRLVWVTREGLEQSVTDDTRDYSVPRFSPDGRRVAVGAGGQLWVYDTQRPTFQRVTSDDTIRASFPVWTPDGTAVVFNTVAQGLQLVETDGAGGSRVIPETSPVDYPVSISTDGETLAFVRLSDTAAADIYTLSLHGEPRPRAVLNTPAYEGGPEFSPDGQWLAYTSDDSGQMQVYLRPVTGPDRRWPVSTQGGRSPKWSRSGRELFYLEGQKMMVVIVTSGADLTLSPPRFLFEFPSAFGPTLTIANYDVSPDAQRFLMVKRATGADRLNVVLNWVEELKRLVPTK